jgi:hypothetical protein
MRPHSTLPNATHPLAAASPPSHTRTPTTNASPAPDGLTRIELWATARLEDGVANRSLTARLEAWTVVANNAATDLAGRPLPPSTTSKTVFPWKNGAAQLTTELPLEPLAGPITAGSRHVLSGRTGANVTGLLVSLDPQTASRPGASDGVVIAKFASSPDGAAVASPPPGCAVNTGDGSPVSCSPPALDPAAVPAQCPGNPCTTGLCDGR